MDSTPADPEPPKQLARRRPVQEFGLLVVVLVICGLLAAWGHFNPVGRDAATNPFLNTENLVDGIATPMSYYAIMAVGVTAVIISGGIDISVGSIMALAGLTTAWALQSLAEAGASPWLTWPASLAVPLGVGLVCGLINGALVVGLRMHPFIVTLGTMAIFRCLCNVRDLTPWQTKTLVLPEQLLTSGSATALLQRPYFGTMKGQVMVGGVQMWPLVFMLAAVVLGWIYLSLTVWGRQTFAVGGNEEAARFSGIPVGWVKLRVYAISGLCAGLAGLVSLGRFGTISTNTATGYELTVIAAAVVGGASLTGGRGTAMGALLGALVLALIEDGISILKWDQEYKLGIVGASIIIAVALDSLSRLVTGRRGRIRS